MTSLLRKVAKGVALATGPLAALMWRRAVKDADEWRARLEALRARPTDLSRFAADNARLRGEAADGRVVFLGASITENMDVSKVGARCVNRGVSGELVWQQLLRLRADVLALRPAAVVLKACAINFGDGAPDPALVKEHMTWMAELAVDHGIRPVLATTVPVTAREEDEHPGLQVAVRAFNGWTRLVCTQRGWGLVDYEAVLGTDRGHLGSDLAADGIHPNAAGYARMIDAARATLESVLARPVPTTPKIIEA